MVLIYSLFLTLVPIGLLAQNSVCAKYSINKDANELILILEAENVGEYLPSYVTGNYYPVFFSDNQNIFNGPHFSYPSECLLYRDSINIRNSIKSISEKYLTDTLFLGLSFNKNLLRFEFSFLRKSDYLLDSSSLGVYLENYLLNTLRLKNILYHQSHYLNAALLRMPQELLNEFPLSIYKPRQEIVWQNKTANYYLDISVFYQLAKYLVLEYTFEFPLKSKRTCYGYSGLIKCNGVFMLQNSENSFGKQ